MNCPRCQNPWDGKECSCGYTGGCIYCGSQTKHTNVCPDNPKYWRLES